jgi:hypothetical protein
MEPSDHPVYPAVDFEAWVIQTQLVQGFPARVEDPTVLARIADLMGIQQVGDCQRGAVTED